MAADPDTTPPTILSAISYSTNNIGYSVVWLGFSERMASNSVFEPTNYQLRSLSGNLTVKVADVLFQPVGTKTTQNILLTTESQIDFTKDWVLTALKIADTNGNITISNRVNLTLVEQLINPEQDWNFLDKGRFADQGLNQYDGHRFFDRSWIAPDYDDIDWDVRPGAFFRGVDGGTPPLYGNTTLCCQDGDVQVASKTAYFRTTFKVQGSILNSAFQIKLMLADGAVMYVNGQEVWRTNISATIAEPIYTTPARGVGSLNWSANYLTLPKFNDFVKPGVNSLAVEVHNDSSEVSRLGWGLELVQRYTNHNAGRLYIARSPSDATNVLEGTVATFDVLPDGLFPFKYQWSFISKANVTNVIAGATNRVLKLDALLSQDGGRVFARVSGGTPNSTNNSATALLTVRADTNAPTILSANYDEDAGGIVVTFSEDMKLSSMTNQLNYTITNHLNQIVPVISASAQDESSIVLKTATPASLAARWYIRTQNLTDNAAAANPLSTALIAVVGGVFTPIAFETDWRFYENGTNPPVTTNWMKRDYSEVGTWKTGKALFGFSDLPPRDIATPLATTDLGGNNLRTYYFRKTFDFGGPSNNLSFFINHITDDGIVVWLNGSIVFRLNMSANPVIPFYTNTANVNVADAVELNTPRQSGFLTNLLQGANQIAVELHQHASGFSDALFDLQLTVTNLATVVTVAPPALPPTVLVTAPVNNTAVVQGAAVALAATATPAVGATITKVEFFDGAVSLGSDTTDPYTGNFDTTLATTVGDHTIRAVATDSKSLTATNSIVVKVNLALPPVLVIDSPANNSSVEQGSIVAINATATPAAGATITKVEFFDGAVSLGSDLTAPYSGNFATTVATTLGDHTIRVVATDSKTLSTTNSIVVKVLAVPPPQPPVVVITAPAAAAAVVQGSSIAFTATATPAVGATITKVEFFDGLVSLGVDTAAPYAAQFATASGTGLGAHSLRAVATDSKGLSAEKTVAVTVTAPPAPKLTVALSADKTSVLISWPAAPGFLLESSSAAFPTSWSVVAGATSPVSATIATGGAAKYYRLRLQ